MRLIEVVVYSRAGATRTIAFHSGLNVITGQSQAGKSALLSIVSYCLGSTTLSVPATAPFRKVAWYGLRGTTRSGTFFVARPVPGEGQSSSSLAMLVAPSASVPAFAELRVNANTANIIDFLGGEIGITDNGAPSADGETPGLSANLSHAKFFSFQEQDEIANRSLLFHRQQEDFIPQAIRDTLPYFLGAVPGDFPAIQAQLREARRVLRRREKQLEAAEMTRSALGDASAELIAEAASAGIISVAHEPSEAEQIRLLESAAAVELGELRPLERAGETLTTLLAQRALISETTAALQSEAALVDEMIADQEAFESALAADANLLEVVDLLPLRAEKDEHSCPICGQGVDSVVAPGIAATRDALAHIIRAERSTELDRQRLRAYRTALEERIAASSVALVDSYRLVEELNRTDERVRAASGLLSRASYVQGRIRQHLDMTSHVDDAGLEALRAQVAEQTAVVRALERRVDRDAIRDAVNDAMNAVGVRLTEHARTLQLEQSEGFARIDLGRLTVVIDTLHGPIPLAQIGSAENWVGYHLAAHVALHQYFADHERPTLRFLFLDQPSQAFYPPDTPRSEIDEVLDSDREAVSRMFSWLNAAARGPKEGVDGMQIIVVDHARLDTPWFREAIVEEWRGGPKLIPDDW